MADFRITAKGHIDPLIQANPASVCPIRYSSPKHNHDFYEFFLITKGNCLHKVNGDEQRLTEGHLVFMRPDDIHWYDSDGDSECEFINIACTKEAIEDAFDYIGDKDTEVKLLSEYMPVIVLLSPSEKEQFLGRYEKLKLLCSIDKQKARTQTRCLIVEILAQYFQDGKGAIKKDMPLWFETLLTRMLKKENYTEGLQRMYELSGRSIGHLNRVFKQYLNITPTEYINHLKLNYAKGLLLTTDLSILETAMEAGFENLSHFYHLFKAEFNTSPADFRQRRSV